MAIIKSVKNSHSSIKHIINYITKKRKLLRKSYVLNLIVMLTLLLKKYN